METKLWMKKIFKYAVFFGVETYVNIRIRFSV